MYEKDQKIKKWRGLMPAIIGITVGIALLLLGSMGGFGDKDTLPSAQSGTAETPSAEEYEREIERRITELCQSVVGKSEISVMVSLKGGYKTVYAMDAQSSSGGYRSEIVKVGSGSAQEGIIIGYENPEISGVGIVCKGGDDARIKSEIVSLVSAALNLSTNKVFVASSR